MEYFFLLRTWLLLLINPSLGVQELFVYVAHDRSYDMYNMLIKEVYFLSRDGHVNLNVWVKYVGVLPKDVTKSQGYNEFTKAFFF